MQHTVAFYPVLRIHIGDLVPYPVPVPIPEFWWPKIVKFTAEIKCIFLVTHCNLLILRPCNGRQIYRRSLQSSKENIQHFKTWNILTISNFVGNFCPPSPGFGSAFPMQTWIRSTNISADPDPQHWFYLLQLCTLCCIRNSKWRFEHIQIVEAVGRAYSCVGYVWLWESD